RVLPGEPADHADRPDDAARAGQLRGRPWPVPVRPVRRVHDRDRPSGHRGVDRAEATRARSGDGGDQVTHDYPSEDTMYDGEATSVAGGPKPAPAGPDTPCQAGTPAGPVAPYDRADISAGIVHIGVGGFHRAHQAMVVDDLLRLGGHREWGICGVGLLGSDA